RGVALGDLDGDGDLDAFLAQTSVLAEGEQPDRVLLNDGKGSFTDTGQLLGDSYSHDVRLADFDADDDLDAWVATLSFFGNDPADIVWLNDGRGFFSDSGQRLGDFDNVIDVADVDGDGDIDVFSSNGQAEPTVWLNDGKATFTIGQTLGRPGSVTGEVAMGDFDGDADPDAFLLGGKPNGETVYLNVSCFADANGDGTLNLLDFLAFQGAWLEHHPSADCDDNAQFNVLDFICFQGLFLAGCE
ncbi:MAG: FG-GAP-like repeat-containing protein, partial [Chloroflexi bacterium]|nr:FG-GAP-like repeat-containing protein [Chloroflexota bacterium]